MNFPYDPDGASRREELLRQGMATLTKRLRKETTRLAAPAATAEAQRAALDSIHSAIMRFANDAESYIAQDELVGANHNGRWLAHRAETAEDILGTYLDTFDLIVEWCERLDIPVSGFRPGRTALAGLQRIVCDHAPGVAEELRQKFRARSLPTAGFDTVVPRSTINERSGATVRFAPSGGVEEVSNVKSSDAKDIVTGIVHRGPVAFSAPAKSSPASQILTAQSSGENLSWWQHQMKEMQAAPAKIAISVLGAGAVAFIGWLAVCKPSDGTTERVSVNVPLTAADVKERESAKRDQSVAEQTDSDKNSASDSPPNIDKTTIIAEPQNLTASLIAPNSPWLEDPIFVQMHEGGSDYSGRFMLNAGHSEFQISSPDYNYVCSAKFDLHGSPSNLSRCISTGRGFDLKIDAEEISLKCKIVDRSEICEGMYFVSGPALQPNDSLVHRGKCRLRLTRRLSALEAVERREPTTNQATKPLGIPLCDVKSGSLIAFYRCSEHPPKNAKRRSKGWNWIEKSEQHGEVFCTCDGRRGTLSAGP